MVTMTAMLAQIDGEVAAARAGKLRHLVEARQLLVQARRVGDEVLVDAIRVEAGRRGWDLEEALK